MTSTTLFRSTWALALLAFVTAIIPVTQAADRLLPFQGRLTDANSLQLSDGTLLVRFQLHDSLTGGRVVWSGESHQLTINGGLINTVLGSKATLAGLDFDQPLYLELTLDANHDGKITAEDPTMLPRQAVIPPVFSVESANSRKLAGHDWSVVFGTSRPGIDGIPGSSLAPASVSWSRHMPRSFGNDLSAGDIAISPTLNFVTEATSPTVVPSSELRVTTSGRPVKLYLVNGLGPGVGYLECFSTNPDVRADMRVTLWRDSQQVAEYLLENFSRGDEYRGTSVPPSVVQFLDTPPAGTWRYDLRIHSPVRGVRDVRILHSRFVIHEL